MPYDYHYGRFNDIDFTLKLIEHHASELAVIMVEPVMGTGGALPATPEFLRVLRNAADQYGIVLLFDEVMTSRVSAGGAQAHYGVTPDMTAFGKYIGGGLTFGVFGGRADIMDLYDPRRPDALPHAGTFNNNVLTMAACVTAMGELYTADVADTHNRTGEAFKGRLNALAAAREFPATITGIDTLLCMHFVRGPLTTPAQAATANPDAIALFHLHMLDCGYYTSKSGLMSLSLPLAPADYEGFERAFATFMETFAAQIQ